MAPPRGHRISTYPWPLRPRRRVLIVWVPPIWRRVLTDPPTSHRARRSRTVRAPPRGHRISTYPRPLRPRRRVLIVCVPPIWRRVPTDPFDEPPRPPEQDRPRAASWAPDQHVPAALTAAAPGVDRLGAAHLAPGPAPQQDRPRAGQAPALASPDSHVTPPAPPAPDCSRRDATGTDPRPTSITDTPAPDLYAPAFTAQERQQLAHADHDSPLAAEVRLLRVLMSAPHHHPAPASPSRRGRLPAPAPLRPAKGTARRLPRHGRVAAPAQDPARPRVERIDGGDAVSR